MADENKENVLENNIAKAEPTGKTKVFQNEPLTDDSDSDSEIVKKVSSLSSLNSATRRKKAAPLIFSSDESDSEIPANIDPTPQHQKFDFIFDSDNEVSENSDNVNSDDDSESDAVNLDPVVLGTDNNKNQDIVVHPKISRKLFKHQIEGVKFMFDRCFNDLNVKRKYRRQDHGCILAHCMGLGKTLQVIALIQTAISYTQLGTNKILVICPKSTIMNWKTEIDMWRIKDGRDMQIFMFPDVSSISQKLSILEEWSNLDSDLNAAGILLLGYESFMQLIFFKSAAKAHQKAETTRGKISNYLLKPGADLVVLDEGHRIKNLKSKTSKAVNQIWTKRRIILTGTPMQNNLNEYYTMVNFIKPNFLGTTRDFAECYANPIRNGQHKDSSRLEVRVMKEKSYILHKKLSKFVQRRDVDILKDMLKEKYEYDLFIPMTDIQTELYEYYLKKNPLEDGAYLLPDYQVFRKIWTHPKVLETAYNAAYERRTKIAWKLQQQQRSESETSDSELNALQRISAERDVRMFSPLNEWWKSRVTEEQRNSILSGNKMKVLFEILNICEREKEKCLVFSEFTSVLDVVEVMMKQITEHVKAGKAFEGLINTDSKWERAWDYCRLDGSTSQTDRHAMIKRFNQPNETRLRVFLISSKAGGQGINLTGATRVVLLDTSWNPSNDQQNIFRVFRLGQKKSCYIYRLLSMGTMEEKVYSRSVTKQATSYRVVDKQQIERHYNMAELEELYTLTRPDWASWKQPSMPTDNILKKLLHDCHTTVFKYHEHDSLLEKEDDLTEEEKEAAWKRYELENKAAEAKLQLENSFNLSQDTPPYIDLDQISHVDDLFLDILNGNFPSKAPLIPSTSGVELKSNHILTPRSSIEDATALMSSTLVDHKTVQDKPSTSAQMVRIDRPLTLDLNFPNDPDTTISAEPTAESPTLNVSTSTTSKRKFKNLDIRDMFKSIQTTPPSKRFHSSRGAAPTVARYSGWLSTKSNSNGPSTSNLSDDVIVLDD